MHRDGMRAGEVARVDYSPAEIERIIVHFHWFGTYAVLIKFSADFISTGRNCSAFSFRKRVLSFFLWFSCFSGFLSSPCLLGTNLFWVKWLMAVLFLSIICLRLTSHEGHQQISAIIHTQILSLDFELQASSTDSIHRPFECDSACLWYKTRSHFSHFTVCL